METIQSRYVKVFDNTQEQIVHMALNAGGLDPMKQFLKTSMLLGKVNPSDKDRDLEKYIALSVMALMVLNAGILFHSPHQDADPSFLQIDISSIPQKDYISDFSSLRESEESDRFIIDTQLEMNALMGQIANDLLINETNANAHLIARNSITKLVDVLYNLATFHNINLFDALENTLDDILSK